MNEAVKVAIQIQFDRLYDEAQAENEEFLKNLDEKIQKIIKKQVKEQVKVQVTKILPKIKQTVNEQLEAEVLTRSCHSSKTSYAVATDLSEMELKKILIEKMEGNKYIQRSDEQMNLYKALVEAYESDKIDEEPSSGPDRGSKRRREGKDPKSVSALMETATRCAGRSTQGSRSRQASTSESAFAEEPMQTTFQMNEPSHPEFNTGAEDQLIVQSSQHPKWFPQQQKPPTSDRDWNKTVPATHGIIQPWISKLAKRSDSRSSFNKLMDTPLDFSNFLINRLKVDTLTSELLAGTTYELMKGSCKSLVEFEYHLEEVFKATTDQMDWVNLEGQQDNDKLYKFKEGNFKRLRIQDIEDMLLLLIQGKLTNLTVEERFAFNVSLRMFTRSIVIQRRMEDLQLGVKSYQKKLNLTKPDSRKDKKYRLMRIDELHKFSDGTLIDIRTALDDRLKQIRMQYLPQSIWRKSDKDRAAVMIQAIDKRLKTGGS
nr:hypothetical protein [Tanacetum cinerariifolium]